MKKTLMLDRAVQSLLNKGFAFVYNGRTDVKKPHDEILSTFSTRMSSEHPNIKYTARYVNESGMWCYRIETHEL